MISKSKIRRLVISEMYNTSLSQLYEQAPPTPDPTAAGAAPATPPADPAATPPTPPADPAAAGGAPAPGVPPTPPTPPADPSAAAGVPPTPPGSPAPTPGAPPATPGVPAPATPGAPAAPTAATAGDSAKKKAAAPPDPEKEPMKAQLNKALMKATASKDSLAAESLRRRSLRFLLEADDKPKIDIGVYANEVARLINNYTSLVDIKKNVISQAEQYLDDEFSDESEELKRKLRNLLRVEYHISLERPEPPGESYAVGAGGGGAGGGA